MSDFGSAVVKSVGRAWPVENWQNVHVAVALSGGGDSVALLRAMLHIKQQVGGAGEISALHVNHQLRGSESEADASWCQQTCQKLSVPVTVLIGKVARRAAIDGDGIEAAARAERYELLTQAAERLGARYLATAHTSDDQAETVLLRVLRGAGLRGVSGIPRTRSLTPSLTLMRPLLDCSREQVDGYLDELGQSFCSDSSNFEVKFTRNRARNELLPLLRQHYNPEVDEALRRFAVQAADAQLLIENLADGLLSRCKLTHTDGQISLAIDVIRGEPSILISEALRIAWRRAELPEQAMTYHWWRKLAQLADGTGESKILNLPAGVRASIDGGRLILHW